MSPTFGAPQHNTASSVADTLKQLNATTFSAKYPDFGATVPASVATTPLPYTNPGTLSGSSQSSFPWMLVIGLAVGVALTFIAVKLWSHWRNKSEDAVAQAPLNPLSRMSMTPPAETLIQELARQMVHSAKPGTPFVQQTVPGPGPPGVVDIPFGNASPGMTMPVAPMPAAPSMSPAAASAAAPATGLSADPNFEPL